MNNEENKQKEEKKEKVKFSLAIQGSTYQSLINRTLGDENRVRRFVSSITSAVSTNNELQECDAGTILSSALLGESLNLSPSPQLGQYYLVPFNSKEKGKVANFILGYKGYIQLAIRSGYYKKLNVKEVKKGELISYNPFTEEILLNPIINEEEREIAETIGYYAMFEYENGFQKKIYWTKEKMLDYANKYSPAFSKKGYQALIEGKVKKEDMWKYSSFWYKSFDDMAKKTMLRQLISKWGIMSIEMQQAYEKDNQTIFEDGTSNFLTINEKEKENIEAKKIKEAVVEPTKVDINEI